MTALPTLLMVTVGGAAPPIVQAIEDYMPQHVVFITSMITATNNTSTTSQVQNDILPHFANSQTFTHDIVEVDLDDLMAVYTKCIAVIKQYSDTYTIVADYTGGTKTMSSGLVLAVRQSPKVTLSLVIGKRRQLAAVYNTPVTAVRQQLSALHSEDRVRSIAMLFDMYEYRAATESARRFMRENALDASDRMWWLQFVQILNGYAFWDNFEHESAFDSLNSHLSTHDKSRFALLLAITGKGKSTGYELVHDLLANATRRATQGRYDDAVARVYRALESLAQARLQQAYAANTSAIPQMLIQKHAKQPIPAKFSGDVEAGMFNAYELLVLFDDPVGKCWLQFRPTILNSIQTRNKSILAHGFTPVSRMDYDVFRKAVDELCVAVGDARVNIGQPMPDFPTSEQLLKQLR